MSVFGFSWVGGADVPEDDGGFGIGGIWATGIAVEADDIEGFLVMSL